MVVETSRWPSNSCTVRMSAPSSRRWVAKEWGGRCGRWRAWGCPYCVPPPSPRAAARIRAGGGGGADRSRGAGTYGWRGRPTARSTRGRRWGICGRGPRAARPSRRRRGDRRRAGRAASRCLARSRAAAAGSIVTRSLAPLPARTVIWLRSKSTSFTRSWAASRSRRPAP